MWIEPSDRRAGDNINGLAVAHHAHARLLLLRAMQFPFPFPFYFHRATRLIVVSPIMILVSMIGVYAPRAPNMAKNTLMHRATPATTVSSMYA